ncbi:MAG: hypothetical protein ACK50P_02140 [Planctomycetaceae bacterium]
MPKHVLSICAASLLWGLVLWFRLPAGPEAGPVQLLAADDSLRWFRGNLHTHTLWSDGDDYPEMVAQWYLDQGYDFLSFTDHNTLWTGEKWIEVEKSKGGRAAFEKLKRAFPSGWVQERISPEGKLETRLKTFSQVSARLNRPGKYLLIQSEEISDKYGGLPIHMNAHNVREMLPPRGGDSVYEVMQRNTDALLAHREKSGDAMLIHLNHPNFGYAIRAEDLMRVRGENFFEVYNGHPGVSNAGDVTHAGCERIWDIMLAHRLTELRLPVMYGLAVDDGHSYHDIPSRNSNPGRGWVMVLASELSSRSLIESLETGRFYSSSGVSLKSVRSSREGLEIEVAPIPGAQYTIEFIGTQRGFPTTSEPIRGGDGKEIWTTRRYSDKIGQVLHTVKGTRGEYRFGPEDLYVRAVITSDRLHPNPSSPGEFERAWAQPAVGPAALAPE